MDCVRAAHEAGADCICLCETNGGMLPFQVEEVVCIVVGEFPGQQFGIHCHNDTGCAVANTLGAVSSGVRQVHGTVNGLGERVGNTDLLTVIADLELKMGFDAVGEHGPAKPYRGVQLRRRGGRRLGARPLPLRRRSAFAHKGGLHASAIARFPQAYEHVNPDAVGKGRAWW